MSLLKKILVIFFLLIPISVSFANVTFKQQLLFFEDQENINGLAFNEDGSKFFTITANVGDEDFVTEWNLSTPYDISTRSYAGDSERCFLDAPDDVNQVDLRFRDPLELKYIGDALLIPLFQARKLILGNYHLQKIPVTIIWSPNDPIIDAQAVKKILTHEMYSQKGDFNCPYHELCTTYMSGKQVCQQVLL